MPRQRAPQANYTKPARKQSLYISVDLGQRRASTPRLRAGCPKAVLLLPDRLEDLINDHLKVSAGIAAQLSKSVIFGLFVQRSAFMRKVGVTLTALQAIVWLTGAANAQAPVSNDPLFELIDTFDQPAAAPQARSRLRDGSSSPRFGNLRHGRAPQVANPTHGRLIHAQANVTIIDRDHIVITLSRDNAAKISRAIRPTR